VQGFYKKDELETLIRRREIRKPLSEAIISKDIADRYYQQRAIRAICESLEQGRLKALLVQATGTGKTRTAISLTDVLSRCNWVKRVLFLADCTSLVLQAERAFRRFLPDCSPVNLVTNRGGVVRVFLSTYPTMMNLIDAEDSRGVKRFGVGHFDLVIIDAAHRSVYQKYGAIFAYFDSLLTGLTATPREESDRNSYELFEREIGLPTDEYGLDQAVADGFLVPFRPISVPLRFPRVGISYADLSDEEKAQWDLLDWEETVQNAGRVDSGAVNAWLFNAHTVDKGLKVLMTQGCHEASGDRLGKSVIFARNHKHAEFIRERFDHNYPHLAGKAARVIDNQVKYAQSLIDEFADPGSDLRIAISVDMLDTGIDIPEIVNLVFFTPVRSRTKFWQMVGRGTRTCKNLFGPGRDKECFWIFDLCQNLEFFLGQGGAESTAAPESLSTRLFRSRLALIETIDQKSDQQIGQKGDQKEMSSILPSGPGMAVLPQLIEPGAPETALGLHRHTLAELLLSHGVGTEQAIQRPAEECNGFGLFIRSLVGLDRNAAKELFAEFLADGTHTATQIRFINEILDELTSRGVMDPARLYDPPFSDLAPTGPEGLFSEAEVDNICHLLDLIKTRAMAAQAA
jgi:type I restriction enzyme R subunit